MLMYATTVCVAVAVVVFFCLHSITHCYFAYSQCNCMHVTIKVIGRLCIACNWACIYQTHSNNNFIVVVTHSRYCTRTPSMAIEENVYLRVEICTLIGAGAWVTVVECVCILNRWFMCEYSKIEGHRTYGSYAIAMNAVHCRPWLHGYARWYRRQYAIHMQCQLFQMHCTSCIFDLTSI